MLPSIEMLGELHHLSLSYFHLNEHYCDIKEKSINQKKFFYEIKTDTHLNNNGKLTQCVNPIIRKITKGNCRRPNISCSIITLNPCF